MCAGAIYAGMDMIVSSGNVTISESEASEDGGSRFLGIRTGDEGSAQVARRRVLRVQGLRGLQADAAPALTQQVILSKPIMFTWASCWFLFLPGPT